jgi:DNA-binding NarL/FixJ family response regulator
VHLQISRDPGNLGEIMTTAIRIFSVDDHPLLREGIMAVINDQPDMQVVAQASHGREAISYFCEHKPDVTLMDLRLPDMSGIDAMIAVREQFPEAHVIILTTFDCDVEIRRALAAGARSYILKSMPPREMAETIRQVHAGKKCIPQEVASRLAEHLGDKALSDREVEVLQRVMGGNRNRDIADCLFISEETVKAHVKHIMEKLGAKDRTQAVTIAVQRGIIQI